jgi:putative heme iron utilization protein
MAVDPEMQAKMAPGFEPVPLAKSLLRSIRAGTLATLAEGGAPFATLTSVATDIDGAPLILISGLSHHTRHIMADPRVSLLLSQTGKGDPLAHPRLTIAARARAIGRDGDEAMRIRRRFLARHPKAEMYADFGDFGFWRLEPEHLYLNGGFARAWDGTPAEILAPARNCAEFIAMEDSAVVHMNADHRDAVKLYATKLAKAEAGPWVVSGIDPEGLDLMAGDRTARIAFPEPVGDGAGLRKVLADLARAARAAP